MKRLFVYIIVSITILSCTNNNKSDKVIDNTKQEIANKNPIIQTKNGELPGGYRYMDQFYMDENGNKVYHGKRVNYYPSGFKKLECFYEHGNDNGCVSYDELGNVISDTRK